MIFIYVTKQFLTCTKTIVFIIHGSATDEVISLDIYLYSTIIYDLCKNNCLHIEFRGKFVILCFLQLELFYRRVKVA